MQLRNFLLQIRIRYIPIGSRRERIYHLTRLFIYTGLRQGWHAASQRVSRRLWMLLGDEKRAARSEYTYSQWIADYEPNADDLANQKRAAKLLTHQPLISILTPVYNPQPSVLADTIESVLAQTYSKWELCLADGASDLNDVREVIDRYAQQDERIKAIHLKDNLGIAENSNQALKLAQGEYIALLDHDDLLAPDMLFEVAQSLSQKPELDIIYFDEDKVSADGRTRLEPWFKPTAFSPDLLLSTNYWMHSVIRKSLVEEQGGFSSGVDGAQDWDLSLKLSRLNCKVQHIPKVFYHWRQVAGSASRDPNAKPWAFAAQVRAIEAHLAALGEGEVHVDFPSVGMVHIVWPQSTHKVSIIIPTRDKADLLRTCIRSILNKTVYPDYEILIIDTGSQQPETQDLYAELAENKRIRIIRYTDEFNFHKVNNFAAQQAQGEYLLFLNNDTEALEATWLNELVGWASRPGVGVVGTKLLYPNGTIQHGGIVMGVEGHGSHIFEKLPEHHYGVFGSPDWYRDYMAVMGACMMLPRKVFDELGGFDEIYQIGYGDIDLCLRAVTAGYRVIYTPFARMIHHEGGTRGFSLPQTDVLRASVQMLPRIIEGDPYYNPNLSYEYRQPKLARPNAEQRTDRILRILNEFGLVDTVTLEMDELTRTDLSRRKSSQIKLGNTKKKLLAVSHELSMSGAPLVLSRLVEYLLSHDYAITIVSPIEGPLESVYQQMGVEVLINPLVLRDARETAEYVKDYDLILANTILAWRAVQAARAFPKPCLWWIHESQFGLDHLAQYLYAAQAFSSAERVIFPSKSTADLYRKYEKNDNFRVIHTGRDFTYIDEHKGKLPFSRQPDKFYLVNVASYEPRKGQDVLIKSIRRINSKIDIECYLIGMRLDWFFDKRLSLAGWRMPNIHLLGELPNEQVWSYLEASDVFVLASRDEALPMSIVEAMYLGKGVIATRVGGVAEIIENEVNGLLVESEDSLAMEVAIRRLATDTELLSCLGENAHKKVLADLTISSFGNKWLQVIGEVVREAG